MTTLDHLWTTLGPLLGPLFGPPLTRFLLLCAKWRFLAVCRQGSGQSDKVVIPGLLRAREQNHQESSLLLTFAHFCRLQWRRAGVLAVQE